MSFFSASGERGLLQGVLFTFVLSSLTTFGLLFLRGAVSGSLSGGASSSSKSEDRATGEAGGEGPSDVTLRVSKSGAWPKDGGAAERQSIILSFPFTALVQEVKRALEPFTGMPPTHLCLATEAGLKLSSFAPLSVYALRDSLDLRLSTMYRDAEDEDAAADGDHADADAVRRELSLTPPPVLNFGHADRLGDQEFYSTLTQSYGSDVLGQDGDAPSSESAAAIGLMKRKCDYVTSQLQALERRRALIAEVVSGDSKQVEAAARDLADGADGDRAMSASALDLLHEAIEYLVCRAPAAPGDAPPPSQPPTEEAEKIAALLRTEAALRDSHATTPSSPGSAGARWGIVRSGVSYVAKALTPRRQPFPAPADGGEGGAAERAARAKGAAAADAAAAAARKGRERAPKEAPHTPRAPHTPSAAPPRGFHHEEEEAHLELVQHKPFGLEAALHAEEQRRLALALMAVAKGRVDLLQLFCRYWRHRVGSESLVQSIQASIDVHLLRQTQQSRQLASGAVPKRKDERVGIAYVEALLRARLFPSGT